MNWAVFAASFAGVLMKSIQQKNVVGGHYWLVAPVSFGIGACEIFIVLNIVITMDWSLWFPISSGGAAGAMLGMYLHNRYVK